MGNSYNSREDTLAHMKMVQRCLFLIIRELEKRGEGHDVSKLGVEEKKIFDEFTPKLKTTTYGSDKYKGYLDKMKPALDHHYAHNRHHPEHFTPSVLHFNYINESFGMDLIDIVEMFCDWKAATLRHDDGNLRKSIAINQKRFGFSDELTAIFLNTADVFDE